MFFKETEKDPKCCKCDAVNNFKLRLITFPYIETILIYYIL